MDIQKILRNTPPATLLYSPLCGPCRLVTACSALVPGKPILVKSDTAYDDGPLVNDTDHCYAAYSLTPEGRLTPDGECLLFPSKDMCDWQKFQWKRGDVLHHNHVKCIFVRWFADDYTKFEAAYCTAEGMFGTFETCLWWKVANPDVIDEYLRNLETKYDGKLNPETLEMEKPEPEFKDGDIVYIRESKRNYKAVVIFRGFIHEQAAVYATLFLDEENVHVKAPDEDYDIFCDREKIAEIRPATPAERHRLFEALDKKGKEWNPKTKTLESILKQPELKPFQHVLVRDDDDDRWRAAIFFGIEEDDPNYPYRAMGIASNCWHQCIPYEGNEHLLGTTNKS